MKSVICLFFVLISWGMNAQNILGTAETHTINSSVFKKERKIRVLLPPGYHKDTITKYNVIYVLDGSWDARVDYVAGAIQYLNEYGDFPPSIVVGIFSDDRTFEFTPTPVHEQTTKNWGDRKIGGGPMLQAFFREEVFPLLKNKYHISSFKGIVGHSLGGTFCIADLSEADPLFNAYIATSPNLDFDDEEIIQKMERTLKQSEVVNRLLYVSIGTEGQMENLFTPGVDRMDGLFDFMKCEGFRFKRKSNQGLDHGTTPLVGTLEGLMYLGEQWSLGKEMEDRLIDRKGDPITELKAHYSSLSDWLGYEFVPTASEVNNIGYHVLNEGEALEAVKVFSWGIQLHPEDANLYDSRGEAQEKSGDIKEALASYEKALSVLEERKKAYDSDTYAYNKEIYTKNIERARKLQEK
ncbi:MAG: alpha/beta hydrolase-fold protein [Bacteroidota bacterium]